MKKIYLLPNVITALGLSCGLFVIFKINMTQVGEANLEVLTATAGILWLAAFVDIFDGLVARAMKAESAFGELFDSLSDAIAFGVAPSVIVLKSLSYMPGTLMSVLLTAAAMLYSVCGVLRLVRFNVMKSEEPRIPNAPKKDFTGIPIPLAALVVVSTNLFLISNEFRSMVTISEETRAWILFFLLITIGYFMISRWTFPALKFLHVRVASFRMVFATVISTVLIIYGLLHHVVVVLFFISWGYIAIGWMPPLFHLIFGKKSTALKNAEPNSEPHDKVN